MPTAREIMHEGAKCVGENETLQAASSMMRDLNVGALPICGDDDRLHGMITDRDIVVKCLAEGADPMTMTASELAQGAPLCVSADADAGDVLSMMEQYQVRRLPVLENHRLVGMISEGDIGQHLGEREVGHLVHAVTAPA